MENNRSTVAGVILAGGRNSRMQGVKKALLEYRGEPFWRRAVAALAGADRVCLSVAEREPLDWERESGLELIPDRYPDIGPLGGIASALQWVEESAVLVLPCDMPLLTAEQVGPLLEDYRNHRRAVFLAEPGGRLHPLAGVYPRDCLPLAERMIRAGNYRAGALARQLDPRLIVPSGAAQALLNINSPEEYERLRRREADSR